MLLRLLHDRRPDMVLSMEMFERDVQSKLDAYLRDEITEDEFLAEARPWKSYHDSYRPMIEFAKRNGLAVIAANLPRKLATKVSKEGMAAVTGQAYVARESTAPRDRYWDAFQEAMQEHGGVSDETLYDFYQAQCLKDDTMAEAITDRLRDALRQGDRPLIVHVCGKFHSNDSLGTVARVKQRMPGLHVEVLSMSSSPNVTRNRRGEYVLRMPSEPEFPEQKQADADDEGAAETETEEEQSGRPALGFMPDYDLDVEGVMVAMLVEGGPAQTAGLQVGDVIVGVDGLTVYDVQSYMECLGNLTIGEQTKVAIKRGGKPLEFVVVVGSR